MKKYTLVLFILLLTLFSCRQNIVSDETAVEIESNYPDWSTETHSNLTDPNYTIVFEQDEIVRIDVVIDSDNWQEMQSDLANNISGFGPGQFNNSDYVPVWVPCSVHFNGIEWYNVGIRFKGNSSLNSTYRSGNKKFPFKLDFDEFEEDYPLLTNQRFYGFRQLSLKNNFDDLSLMREKVSTDLFRAFSVPSARAAFCELYIDHGSGSQYFGVYTIVEEVDDTVLESQFYSSTGNLYKPEGDAASFASGTYNESEMNKKLDFTGDYADVELLYTIMNSSDHTNNTASWIQNLETIFDVDHFLRWLAANTVMQNWDTYGKMTHNYYLYNNPNTNKLTWIPWDGNEALKEGKQGGSLSLSLDEVDNSWPLIRYIIDNEDYQTTYHEYMNEFIENVFNPSEILALYNEYYSMLKEYVYAEDSNYSFLRNDSNFDQAVDDLIAHCQDRYSAVQDYLD